MIKHILTTCILLAASIFAQKRELIETDVYVSGSGYSIYRIPYKGVIYV